jgi:tetratricopeptide (TPR) repeat protein
VGAGEALVEEKAAMSRALVTTSRYSPGNLSGETLERLFVGRSDLLEEVLKRITTAATNKEKHHILLVGPRGIGKTHFVSLLSHRLASRPEYAVARERLRIAHLSEDEWGVATYLDLLIRIIRALALRSGTSQDETDLESIRDTFQRSSQAATDLAQKVIRRQVGSGVLLLICENLAELLEALGEEGQRRWRSFIQETMFWTILATTTSLSPGIRLHSSPFYGFFAVKQLERLDPASAVELLRRKALLDGREDLAQFLTTPLGRARVRAIHHLAGGNHRVYVIMSEFLNKESLEDSVIPFMRMADDLTPYYQDRMRQLAASQRKIIDTLCREAKPLIVKDIASRCLMSPQTAAKQLGELDSLGFVARTRAGRESYYELAEPLMRICVEVKDNRTEHLRLFVEFLRRWFTARELQSRFEILQNMVQGGESFDCTHLRVALYEYQKEQSEPLLESLREELFACFSAKDWPGMLAAAERLSAERNVYMYHVLAIIALEYMGRYTEALERAKEVMKNFRDKVGVFSLLMVPALVGMRRREEARHLFLNLDWESIDGSKTYSNAAYLLIELKEHEMALMVVDRAIARFPDKTHFKCTRGSILYSLGRFEEVINNECNLLEREPEHLHSYVLICNSLLRLGHYLEAEQKCRKFLRSVPEDPLLLSCLSRALHRQDRFLDALQVAEAALERHPERAELLCARGEALFELGRYDDVLRNEEQLLRLDPRHHHSYAIKIEALLRLSRFDEAAELGHDWVVKAPSDRNAWRQLAHVFYHQGDWMKALEIVSRGLALHRNEPNLVMLKINALHRLDRHQDILATCALLKEAAPPLALGLRAVQSLESIGVLPLALEVLDSLIERFPSHAEVWQERVRLLCAHRRYSDAVDAAAKALSLASDDIISHLVEAEALVGFDGLNAGLRSYERALSRFAGAQAPSSNKVETLKRVATALLTCEIRERGALSLARQSVAIREMFVRQDRLSLLSVALTHLLKHLLRTGDLAAEEWSSALPLLEEAWGSILECRIPLEMLSVAVRYAQTQDASILLSLPLEQRTLLTGYLEGSSRAGKEDRTSKPVRRAVRSRIPKSS